MPTLKRNADPLLRPDGRVCDPGTAALDITVGGLSTGNTPYRFTGDPARRAITGSRELPSPFKRVGFGIEGMIKPEALEFGGDEVFDRTGGRPD